MTSMLTPLFSLATVHPSRVWALCTLAFLLSGFSSVSANTGVSEGAPEVRYYVGMTEACCGEDPHPVHGVATGDGGVVVVGKTLGLGEGWGGFALKVGPPAPLGIGVLLDPLESSEVRWSRQLGDGAGKSAFLNAASTESAVFLAGLLAEGSGQAAMYLAKHTLADGALSWELRLPELGGQGAIEAIDLTPEGGLVAVGVANAPQGGLEGFKSFGNPFGGQAHVFYLSPAQVASGSAPDAPQWVRALSGHETAKSVRALPGAEGGFIVLVGSEEAPPTLLRLDHEGETLWEMSYPGRYEATDLALHQVGEEHLGYTFTGHGGEGGALDGQLTRVDLNGEVVWARSLGDPAGGVGPFAGLGSGEPQLIYDECWGIQGLADGGVIVGCGTGIEGCDVVSDVALKAQCQKDPRRTWRGYVLRLDAEGDLLWQRVDSFVEEGAEDGVADAASEYVALLSDGGFLSVVDQGFGLGLLVLEGEGSAGAGRAPEARQESEEAQGEVQEREGEPRELEPREESDPELDEEVDEESDEEGCQGAGGPGLPALAALWLGLWASRRRLEERRGG